MLALWLPLSGLTGLLTSAWALDAHGPPLAPPTGEGVADPLTVWAPDLSRRVALSLAVERGDDLLLRQIDTGDGVLIQPILDDVLLSTLAARVPITRAFGLSIGVPFYLSTADGLAGSYTGPGDLRFGLPIGLGDPARLSFGLLPEFAIPTGGGAAYVGSQGAASLLGMIGARPGRLAWALNAGINLQPGATVDPALDADLDRTAQLRLGASISLAALPWLGLGAEAWSTPSLSGGLSDAPAEGLLRAGIDLPAGLGLSLAGGTTLTGDPGSASRRLLASVQWRQPPPRPAPVVVEPPPPPPPPTPYDLIVTALDGQGRPVDALLAVRNGPDPLQIGADGTERLTLAPGLWEVELSAPGLESQRRSVLMEGDRYQPVTLTAVLLPAEGGAEIRLEVVDYQGAPVNNATVSIDGRSRGQTSTGGTLGIAGLREGERTISVDAPDFRPAPSSVQLGPGPTTQRLYLARPPGSVRVVTRTEVAPVGDALLRLIGPEDVPETAVGADGEHTFVLAPGAWTILASSAAFGMQERDVTVDDEGRYQEVEFLLQQPEEQGMAGLLLRVIDPDGNPVEGAEVQLEGHRLGTTGTAGTLKVLGLRPGTRTLSVSGERFRPVEPRQIELAEGLREAVIVLPWLPGSVQVVARGPEGALVDAEVRWSGPAEIPGSSLGPDGEERYRLDPGEWQLFISSSAFGLQERTVLVRPDDVQLVEIDARLLRPEGEARLEIAVIDPDGGGPGGAEVTLDGQPVGTTGPGGVLRVSALAPGKHTVRVDGELIQAAEQSITLRDGDNRLVLRPRWEGRRVKVSARSAEGPATDTLIRMVSGGVDAEVLPPLPVLPDGTRTLAVDPGAWTLLGSSERYGLAEQDLTVAPGSSVQPVDLLLSPPAPSTADLIIEITDPAGRPVPGLRVTVALPGQADSQPRDPGPDARLVLSDLPLAPLTVSAAAPGYAPLPALTVPLVAGSQQRQLRMDWLPRTVRLQIRDEKGRPLDAAVRLTSGRQALTVQTGPDGTEDVPLTPGDWQILVEGGGDRASVQQALAVPPGGEPLAVPLTLARTRIEVTVGEVVIREQVFFALNRALIEPRSFAVLSEVAATLRLHPEIRSVEIQGHTDDLGDDALNAALSQARADAVRDWLIRAGVEPGRLVAVGYGSTQPLAPNTTEANRRKNRRVQFEIKARQTEEAGEGAGETPAGTPAQDPEPPGATTP